MEKRYATAACIFNEEGLVLIAKRAPTKISYPNTWSLPSTYVRDAAGNLINDMTSEESARQQLAGAIKKKLGLEIILGRTIGRKEG